MILLALLNWFLNQVNIFASYLSQPIQDYLINLSTNISALQIPVILYDYLELCVLFLPIGTICTLLFITIALIVIQTVLGLFHFLAHIGNIL